MIDDDIIVAIFDLLIVVIFICAMFYASCKADGPIDQSRDEERDTRD